MPSEGGPAQAEPIKEKETVGACVSVPLFFLRLELWWYGSASILPGGF